MTRTPKTKNKKTPNVTGFLHPVNAQGGSDKMQTPMQMKLDIQNATKYFSWC